MTSQMGFIIESARTALRTLAYFAGLAPEAGAWIRKEILTGPTSARGPPRLTFEGLWEWVRMQARKAKSPETAWDTLIGAMEDLLFYINRTCHLGLAVPTLLSNSAEDDMLQQGIRHLLMEPQRFLACHFCGELEDKRPQDQGKFNVCGGCRVS
jgi:hypothetical protein